MSEIITHTINCQKSQSGRKAEFPPHIFLSLCLPLAVESSVVTETVERLAGAEGVRHTLTLSPSSEDTAIVLVAGWEEGCRVSPTWESAGDSHVRW